MAGKKGMSERETLQELWTGMQGEQRDPVLAFYSVIKKSPEHYRAFNNPKLFSDHTYVPYIERNLGSILREPMEAIYNKITNFIILEPQRFFKIKPTVLKFLAEEFPIIYYALFRSMTSEYANYVKYLELRDLELSDFKEIPHLRTAYRNIPGKFKRGFNESLLVYWNLKTNKAT